MSKEKKQKINYTIHADMAVIVRLIRKYEESGLRFKSFITLTFKKEPTHRFRKANFLTIKKIAKHFMESGCNAVYYCLDETSTRKHFHMATDKTVGSIKDLKKYWPYGYVKYEIINMHKKVKHYMHAKMSEKSKDNFRLYLNRERILEIFLEDLQKHRYK